MWEINYPYITNYRDNEKEIEELLDLLEKMGY